MTSFCLLSMLLAVEWTHHISQTRMSLLVKFYQWKTSPMAYWSLFLAATLLLLFLQLRCIQENGSHSSRSFSLETISGCEACQICHFCLTFKFLGPCSKFVGLVLLVFPMIIPRNLLENETRAFDESCRYRESILAYSVGTLQIGSSFSFTSSVITKH